MNLTDQVGLFGKHPRVWHPLLSQEPRIPRTLCGLWPDIFTKYAAVRPVEHALGGGKCARIACRCDNTLRMCWNCTWVLHSPSAHPIEKAP